MGALVTPISVALTCRVEEPSTASKPDLRTAARTRVSLFDHLVGERQQIRRDGEPKRLCRPEIERQLELRGPHYRQVGNIGALKTPPDLDANLIIATRKAGTVAHQPPADGKFPDVIDRRN